jgi:hypothetical protein
MKNKLESLKRKLFSFNQLIDRRSEALNAEQQDKICHLQQKLSSLLSYRFTSPPQHWLLSKNKFSAKNKIFSTRHPNHEEIRLKNNTS